MTEPMTTQAPEGQAAPRQFVLASRSPRRTSVLLAAGYAFTQDSPDVDEHLDRSSTDAGAVAEELAQAKAEAVAARHGTGLVLAADTVVEMDGRLFSKPSDRRQALEMLMQLRGRTHRVVTAVAISRGGTTVTAARTTLVTFRDFTEAEAVAYVSSGQPMDKAGAYGIQDRPFSPASDYAGCYLNVVGLPLCLTAELLDHAEVRPAGGRLPVCDGHRNETASGALR
jgi:MAF protein